MDDSIEVEEEAVEEAVVVEEEEMILTPSTGVCYQMAWTQMGISPSTTTPGTIFPEKQRERLRNFAGFNSNSVTLTLR